LIVRDKHHCPFGKKVHLFRTGRGATVRPSGRQRRVVGPLPSGSANYLPFLPFFLLFLLFLATRITSFLAREVNDVLTTRVNISLTYAGCRYAVTVASKNLTRRITAALGDLDVADGPMSRLDAARRLREAADELEAAQVEAARKAGATWSEIGSCYGLTKQGAQQRFRAARHQAKAGAAPGAEAPGRRAGPEPG
jgi:hypothetical protein